MPIEVAPVTPDEFEQLLPLIADYQRFYRVLDPNEARNREFFRRFLAPSEDGMLLAARGDGGEASAAADPGERPMLGYACLFWHYSSTMAMETVLLNDLFVREAVRGEGVGRALIEASAEIARERGAYCLEWATEPENETAQRLYDTTGATRSEWIEYELPL